MEESLSSQTIYEGIVLKLRLDEVRLPDSKRAKREIVEHSDAVAVVAVDRDNNILLVKQFRKPAEEELLAHDTIFETLDPIPYDSMAGTWLAALPLDEGGGR